MFTRSLDVSVSTRSSPNEISDRVTSGKLLMVLYPDTHLTAWQTRQRLRNWHVNTGRKWDPGRGCCPKRSNRALRSAGVTNATSFTTVPHDISKYTSTMNTHPIHHVPSLLDPTPLSSCCIFRLHVIRSLCLEYIAATSQRGSSLHSLATSHSTGACSLGAARLRSYAYAQLP